MKSVCSIGVMFLIAVSLSFSAFAGEGKDGDRPGGSVIQVSSITATVEAINYEDRTIALKGPKGDVVVLKVSEEAKNFNKVKKGDKITFDYYESTAIDIQKSTGKPKAVETQTITRSKEGEKPRGKVETTGYMTAKVESIDYKSRMVTLKMPHGDTMSFKVGDQVKRLNEIKKGDEVAVTYTQAMVISVH